MPAGCKHLQALCALPSRLRACHLMTVCKRAPKRQECLHIKVEALNACNDALFDSQLTAYWSIASHELAAAMHTPSDSMCCRVQTSTPPCFEWIKRISYATYGYSALVKNEFQGLGLQPGDDGFDVPDAETLIPANIQTSLTLGENAGVLITILIGLRTILYVQMRLTIAMKAL